MKNTRKKTYFYDYIAAWIIPCAVLLIVYVIIGIYPFGDKTIAKSDLYHQYIPFLAELQRKLKTGETLAWSWRQGMGTDFYALMVYYLMSPLNLLLYVWPEGNITEFALFLVIVKTGLCGCGMLYYLSDKNGERWLKVICSIFYALSGFIVYSGYNIMWLDVMFMAPVVIVSLEKLIEKGSVFLYTVALGLSIIFNYYMAMMLCIFLCIYLLHYVSVHGTVKKERKAAVNNFLIGSLLAGMLTGFALIPEIHALAVSSTNSPGLTFGGVYHTWLNVLLQHYGIGKETNLPVLYCGLMSVPVLYVMFSAADIPKKTKTADAVVLLILIASTNIPVLMCIWHGMRLPRGFYNRHVFLYAFFVLKLVYDTLACWSEEKNEKLVKGLMASAVLFFLTYTHSSALSEYTYLILLSVQLLYIAIVSLYGSKCNKKMLVGALFACAVIETGCVSLHLVNGEYCEREVYLEEAAETGTGSERITNHITDILNDGMLHGYNSPSAFSSLLSSGFNKALERLGMNTMENTVYDDCTTPVTDMLFGVKRHIYKDADGSYYDAENRMALPLCFVMRPEYFDAGKGDKGISYQNRIMENITGKPAFIYKREIKGKVINESLSSGDDIIELAVPSQGGEYVQVDCRIGEEIFSICSRDIRHTIDLSAVKTVELDSFGNQMLGEPYFKDGCEITGTIYSVDEAALMTAYDTLHNGIEEVCVDETEIRAKVNLDAGEQVFIAVPYEKGWSAFVDGEPAVIKKCFNDAFMAVDAEPGQHDIRLEYHIPGLKEGIYISIAAAIMLLFYCALLSIAKRK